MKHTMKRALAVLMAALLLLTAGSRLRPRTPRRPAKR